MQSRNLHFPTIIIHTYGEDIKLESLVRPHGSGAGTGGATGPPIFGRSVNPIQTGGGQIMPTITTGPPKVFHLPASLHGEGEYK
jgi:hypothetical protein